MKKTRKQLIDLLFEYIREKLSTKPTKDELIELCHTTILLFPSLKTENSEIGGIVSFFSAI